MFADTVFGKFINVGIKAKLRKAIPVFDILLASVFIMRGIEFRNTILKS